MRIEEENGRKSPPIGQTSTTSGNVVEVRCTTGEGGTMVKGGVYSQRRDITGLWRQFVINVIIY